MPNNQKSLAQMLMGGAKGAANNMAAGMNAGMNAMRQGMQSMGMNDTMSEPYQKMTLQDILATAANTDPELLAKIVESLNQMVQERTNYPSSAGGIRDQANISGYRQDVSNARYQAKRNLQDGMPGRQREYDLGTVDGVITKLPPNDPRAWR